jgi:hypothetical protein
LLPDRPTWIDDTNRAQHYRLGPDDPCLFFGEYFAGKGYQGGGTNQLIMNLKIKPTVVRQNPPRGRYKEQAILEVAGHLRRVLGVRDKEQWTWVPVPTSKCPEHPDYDDRLHRILGGALQGHNADLRPLLRQTRSTEADHEAQSRLSPEDLYNLLEVDHSILAQGPIRTRGIILFDDVLTTGKHLKCCGRRLLEVVPGTRIVGMFIARRVLDLVSAASEFEPISDDH